MDRHAIYPIYLLKLATEILGKVPSSLNCDAKYNPLDDGWVLPFAREAVHQKKELESIPINQGISKAAMMQGFKLYLDLKLSKGYEFVLPISLTSKEYESTNIQANIPGIVILAEQIKKYKESNEPIYVIIPIDSNDSLFLQELDIVKFISQNKVDQICTNRQVSLVLSIMSDDGTIVYYHAN